MELWPLPDAAMAPGQTMLGNVRVLLACRLASVLIWLGVAPVARGLERCATLCAMSLAETGDSPSACRCVATMSWRRLPRHLIRV